MLRVMKNPRDMELGLMICFVRGGGWHVCDVRGLTGMSYTQQSEVPDTTHTGKLPWLRSRLLRDKGSCKSVGDDRFSQGSFEHSTGFRNGAGRCVTLIVEESRAFPLADPSVAQTPSPHVPSKPFCRS